MRKSMIFMMISLIFFTLNAHEFTGSELKKEDKIQKKIDLKRSFKKRSGVKLTDLKKVKPLPNLQKRSIKIAVIGLENTGFWLQVKGGVIAAQKRLKKYGVSVHWIIPPENIHNQGISKMIQQAVKREYDAIAAIGGNQSIIPAIEYANNNGIPVALFNAEPAVKSPHLFYVGADSYQQGIDAAKGMIRVMGKSGKIVVMTGFYSVDEHQLRRKGFLDYIKKYAPDIDVVSEMENLDDESKAYIQTIEVLQKNPDLKGIYITAGGPPGVANAIKYMKRKGIKIICFDLTPEHLELLNEGVITGILGQNPFAQGYEPVIRLYNYLIDGTKLPAKKLLTNEALKLREGLKKSD